MIPTETCASIAETVANSIATSSVARMKFLIWLNLPDPIVRTKGRNTSGSAICNCQRYSWPHVQALPTPPQSRENLEVLDSPGYCPTSPTTLPGFTPSTSNTSVGRCHLSRSVQSCWACINVNGHTKMATKTKVERSRKRARLRFDFDIGDDLAIPFKQERDRQSP